MKRSTLPDTPAVDTTGHALPEWRFTSAQSALFWSVEVLRRRRLPKLAAAWRVLGEGVVQLNESGDEQAAQVCMDVEVAGAAQLGWLPQQGADRYALALSVLGEVYRMPQQAGYGGALLLAYAWGDWVTDLRLQRALRFQEAMRRQGVRVLINYRYTFRQLAELYPQNCGKTNGHSNGQGNGQSNGHNHGDNGGRPVDGKAMWRRVQGALGELEIRLMAKGLLVLPDAALPMKDPVSEKDVRILKQGLTIATT